LFLLHYIFAHVTRSRNFSRHVQRSFRLPVLLSHLFCLSCLTTCTNTCHMPSDVCLCSQSLLHFIVSIRFSLQVIHATLFRHCPTGSRTSCAYNCLVSIRILLSGDIPFNPGSTSNVSSLNMCILNVRSFTNSQHNTTLLFMIRLSLKLTDSIVTAPNCNWNYFFTHLQEL
jgi:hypothetical protein